MPIRDITAITQRLFAELSRWTIRFPGYRRFGPRSVLAAVHLLIAGCLVQSYDEALEEVMRQWGDELEWENTPSRSGLTRARKMLGTQPFREVWEGMLHAARELAPTPHITGLPEARRYLAVDGTKMLMPDETGVRLRWKQAGATINSMPQALMISAIDICQRLPVAASVSGLDIGERQAALDLIGALDQTDVLLFDRGYPGRAFFADLHGRSMDWCARMTVGPGAFPEVNAFWASGADDSTQWLDLGDGGLVKVRLIRRRFDPGRPPKHQDREHMVVITTLLDQQRYPTKTILDLYHARWQAETFFREIKTVFGIESFHSRDPDGIMQEVYAISTWMTVAAMIEREADAAIADIHGPQPWDDPERIAVNRSQLIRAIQRQATGFLDHDPQVRNQANARLHHDIQRLVNQAVRKRPGRSAERRRKRPWGRYRKGA